MSVFAAPTTLHWARQAVPAAQASVAEAALTAAKPLDTPARGLVTVDQDRPFQRTMSVTVPVPPSEASTPTAQAPEAEMAATPVSSLPAGRSGVLAFDQDVPFQPRMRAGTFVPGAHLASDFLSRGAVTPDRLRQAAMALAAARTAMGVTALAAPSLIWRPWVGDTRGVPARVRAPCRQRVRPARRAPGLIAAQVRLSALTRGALEPGQVGGHCQPQLIGERRWMIGRDQGQICGVHHAQTLRPPPATTKPANPPGAA
jgi:hypothetical protein